MSGHPKEFGAEAASWSRSVCMQRGGAEAGDAKTTVVRSIVTTSYSLPWQQEECCVTSK